MVVGRTVCLLRRVERVDVAGASPATPRSAAAVKASITGRSDRTVAALSIESSAPLMTRAYTIAASREDPKIPRVDDAEIVGDG